MAIKKISQKNRTDAELNECFSIETLSVVNVAQLCWILGTICLNGIIVVCSGFFWFLKNCTRRVVSLIGAALRICMFAVGFLARIFFGIVHTIAAFLSYISIELVSILGGAIFWTLRSCWMFLWVVLFGIPFFLCKKLISLIVFLFRSATQTFFTCKDAAGAIPHTIHQTIDHTRSSFELPAHWYRRLGVFVTIALLFTIPIPAIRSLQFFTQAQAQTSDSAKEAFTFIQAAKVSLLKGSFDDAHKEFVQGLDQLTQAEQHITQLPSPVIGIVSSLPLGGAKVAAAQNLIRVGQDTAHAGIILSDAGHQITPEALSSENVLKTISVLLNSVEDAQNYIADAHSRIMSISPVDVPNQYASLLSQTREQLDTIYALGSQIVSIKSTLLASLGDKGTRRYLFLFQNNSELRPTGGFIGSYAVIDVADGKILQVEIPGGGSYDLQGALTEHVQSPFPLHVVRAEWQFQDANWFPDFPTSAQKILWFYEHSGGAPVDGVVAINASFFQNLLGIIGSIPMESYGKTITAKNFMLETQKAVELEYDKTENKPKQFIADLFPKVMNALTVLSQNQQRDLLSLIIQSCASRDIQVYLSNHQEERAVVEEGLAGEVRSAPLDYFFFNEANVGGGKAEEAIRETLSRKTIFNSDGTIDVDVTIDRKHNGVIGDPFTGTRNISYTRFYFPAGTKALSASGFIPPDPSLFKIPMNGYLPDQTVQNIEGDMALDPKTGMTITNEFNKTAFGEWITLYPGQEAVVHAVFRLPFRIDDIPRDQYGRRLYTLLIQHQSGSPISQVSVSFENHGSDSLIKTYPEMARQSDSLVSDVLSPFNSDTAFGVTLGN